MTVQIYQIKEGWREKDFTSADIMHHWGFDNFNEFLNLQRNADLTFLSGNNNGDLIFTFNHYSGQLSEYTTNLMRKYDKYPENELVNRMKETSLTIGRKSFIQIDVDVLQKYLDSHK